MAAVRTSEVRSTLAPFQWSTVEFVVVISLRLCLHNAFY